MKWGISEENSKSILKIFGVALAVFLQTIFPCTFLARDLLNLKYSGLSQFYLGDSSLEWSISGRTSLYHLMPHAEPQSLTRGFTCELAYYLEFTFGPNLAHHTRYLGKLGQGFHVEKEKADNKAQTHPTHYEYSTKEY